MDYLIAYYYLMDLQNEVVYIQVLKYHFYNVNIEKIEIINDENMIREISYLSFEDLLELETKKDLSEVKVHNQSKILTISLN